MLCASCRRGLREAPPPQPTNIILISIDTLRADHLGAYGYSRPTSPNLDGLAAEGAVFEDVTSTSPWTLPSHGSMLTGRYPTNHGLRALGTKIDDQVPTLAETLQERGFSTAAFTNSTYFSTMYGMRRGFEAFQNVPEDRSQVRPSLVLPYAAKWLVENRKEPFFLFLHLYDVHSDYRALRRFRRPFRRPYKGDFDGSTHQLVEVQDEGREINARDAQHLVDLYDAGIRQTDHVIGGFLDVLRELDLLDRTILFVTSDHGEEFLDHGNVLHGSSMHEELLRVPLIVRGPGVGKGVRVQDPVSIVDIAPTALALAGLPPVESVDGVDLSRSLTGQPLEERPIFAEADHRSGDSDQLQAVRLGRHKLHRDKRDGTITLYDLDDDPTEMKDISENDTELVSSLTNALDQFLGSRVETEAAGTLSDEQIERLRGLGYIME